MKPNQRKRKAIDPVEKSLAASSNDWEAAVGDFLRAKKSANLRPSTLRQYAWVLNGERLNDYRAEHGITAARQLTLEVLQSFQTELLSEEIGLSPSGVDSMHRVIKNFLTHTRKAGAFDVDHRIASWEPPKGDTKPKEIFLPGEIDRLVDACDHPRDQFLVRFIANTGLRLEEITRVKITDIPDDLSAVHVVELAKGRKYRDVPLEHRYYNLSKDLRRYLNRHRPKDTNRSELFLTRKKFDTDQLGQPLNGLREDYRPLHPHSIQTLFRRLGERTGIHCNPHKFRHSLTTQLAEYMQMAHLQRVMGHSSPIVTAQYFHPTVESLIKVMKGRPSG